MEVSLLISYPSIRFSSWSRIVKMQAFLLIENYLHYRCDHLHWKGRGQALRERDHCVLRLLCLNLVNGPKFYSGKGIMLSLLCIYWKSNHAFQKYDPDCLGEEQLTRVIQPSLLLLFIPSVCSPISLITGFIRVLKEMGIIIHQNYILPGFFFFPTIGWSECQSEV